MRYVKDKDQVAKLYKIAERIQTFSNSHIMCQLKECKLNSDGHVLARFTILNVDDLRVFRSSLDQVQNGNINSTVYNRYENDPESIEKETTLASVLLTIDYDHLSVEAIAKIKRVLEALTQQLKAMSPFLLSQVVWSDYAVRTLGNDHRIRTRNFFSQNQTESVVHTSSEQVATEHNPPFFVP